MNNKDKIRKAADWITSECEREGIKVEERAAYGTNSIYLTLDNGALDSIRISDHSARRNARHKYNLLTINKWYKRTSGGQVYYFSPIDCYERLMCQILRDRNRKGAVRK